MFCPSHPTLSRAIQASRICTLFKLRAACVTANVKENYSEDKHAAFENRDCRTSLMGGARLSSGIG